MAAYWVVRVNVLDAKKLQAYAPLAAAAVESHGGRYLARGGAHETTEGSDYGRNEVRPHSALGYQTPAAYAEKTRRRGRSKRLKA